MKQFKIVPLSSEYAKKIKENNRDDFGHEVIEQVATGKGPCRVSLRPFVVGKDVRLLSSHTPFVVDNAFNQPGPVFIHKKEVEAYSDIHLYAFVGMSHSFVCGIPTIESSDVSVDGAMYYS